jgi:hypothetical protein
MYIEAVDSKQMGYTQEPRDKFTDLHDLDCRSAITRVDLDGEKPEAAPRHCTASLGISAFELRHFELTQKTFRGLRVFTQPCRLRRMQETA